MMFKWTFNPEKRKTQLNIFLKPLAVAIGDAKEHAHKISAQKWKSPESILLPVQQVDPRIKKYVDNITRS